MHVWLWHDFNLNIKRETTALYTQRQGFQEPWLLALSLSAKQCYGCEIPSSPPSVIFPLSSIRHPSSIHPPSIFHASSILHPSSILSILHLPSVIYPLSFILHPPSFVIHPPFLFLHPSFFVVHPSIILRIHCDSDQLTSLQCISSHFQANVRHDYNRLVDILLVRKVKGLARVNIQAVYISI